MNIEIANRFQQLRKKQGLSQEELAEKIGVSRQAVSKWERAEASPDTDNLILLSKLYGVSLDELLRTDSVQIGSEGVSLKKEDYGFSDESVKEMRPDNYTDEEIYPGRSSEEKASESKDGVKEKLSAAGLAVGDVINAVGNDREHLNERVKTAGHAIGDAVSAAGSAAKSEIKKQKARKSFEGKYEDAMDKFESGLENGMDRLGRGIEKSMDKLSDSMDKFEESVGNRRNYGQTDPKPEKMRLSLFDKTFPLLIVFVFFMLVAMGAAHPGWTVFLLIPLYYTFKEAVRKKNPMIFCYPVLCAFIYFFIGGMFDDLKPRWSHYWYNFMWLIFLTIPLYYTGYTAIKKRNPLIFCYPVVCVMVYIGGGLITDFLSPRIGEFWFAAAWLPILATIPFYYIVISHFRQKRKA